MAEHDDERGSAPEGLAGGPGPTPPGFDDGMPKPLEGSPAGQAGGIAAPAASERPAPRGDPEEPDPS